MTTEAINLSNWRLHPQNQWSFINVDKILPTATIDASTTPSTLPSSPMSWSNFQLKWKDGKILTLDDYIQASQTDSLIILHQGKILYENYFNNNTPSSKHILMSMSKSITSLLIGILQGQGKLSVSDLLTKHIPEMSSTIFANKTIQQCLDMRTSFNYNDNSPEYRESMGWNPPSSNTSQTLKSFLTNFSPDSTFSESKFEYCSVNTDLLGWVLERASGMKLSSLLQKYLWEPLGCESPALITLDRPEGLGRAAGGICATLRDTARIAQMLLNDGKK
ncbi:6-aminohexanoate-dimer hydrolase [Pseudocercospora fuligena]|uniref:6-aminohexanoate-dimer hydrolase n=1 Tax=Pseudocercospora fuligena TaxID=685502 RepID=A0A8H6RB89_9PEZI|nr:6-aminohexanoate-dimer hydrolase [Pseudocercospora fuligena]